VPRPQISLPQAGGEAVAETAKPINVAVDASEHYAIIISYPIPA
jgi:hypothetical protein